MAVLTLNEVYALARNAGADRDEGILLTSFTTPESGNDTEAVNPESGAAGLWQIHPPFPGVKHPKVNAHTAVIKLRTQGPTAWTVYSSGKHRDYLPAARAAAQRVDSGQVKVDLARLDLPDLPDLPGPLPNLPDLPSIPTSPGEVWDDVKGAAGKILGPLLAFLREAGIRVAEFGGGASLILIGLMIIAADAIL